MQIKADTNISTLKDGKTISYALERKYINTWRDEPFPVIFALYDADRKIAYWLHIQPFIDQLDDRRLPPDQQYVTLQFDIEKSAINQEAVRTRKHLNDDILARFKALREAKKQDMTKPP